VVAAIAPRLVSTDRTASHRAHASVEGVAVDDRERMDGEV
jgi:hypothetical protein